MTKTNELEKYLLTPESKMSEILFSNTLDSLIKIGPMSKDKAAEMYFKLALNTHPLYIASQNDNDFYLFY